MRSIALVAAVSFDSRSRGKRLSSSSAVCRGAAVAKYVSDACNWVASAAVNGRSHACSLMATSRSRKYSIRRWQSLKSPSGSSKLWSGRWPIWIRIKYLSCSSNLGQQRLLRGRFVDAERVGGHHCAGGGERARARSAADLTEPAASAFAHQRVGVAQPHEHLVASV